MEGVRQIATAYYQRSSDREKESAEAFFRQLDANGDGRVSLAQLKKSVPSWISNEAIFLQLDENRDGALDFWDILAVYYMVKKADLMVCTGCYALLYGAYFSCVLCLGNGNETFDLCCACYRKGRVPHRHSPAYMLDHHSLLGELRKRATQAEKSQRKKEMEELREIAKAHYRAGSPEVQSLAYAFYQSMDNDGDGKVDLSEFLAFMKHEAGYSQMRSRDFFCDLDQDGNGSLDFFDVMTLYYIVKSGRPFCDACSHFIPGIYFSCVECFKSPKTPFNLCCDCYRSAKCNHNHNGRTQFLDNYTLLEATRNSSLAQATGVNSVERSPISSSNAIVAAGAPNYNLVPLQQTHMYMNSSYPTPHNNVYMVPPPSPTPIPIYINTIVTPAPAPPSNKWNTTKVAFKALEVAITVGSAAGACIIM